MKIARLASIICLGFLGTAAGCGKDKIVLTCDESKPYQTVVEGKRIDVPDDLDPLDEVKEIPIPRAKGEPRPPGGRCIEEPPSVLAGR